MPYSGPKPTEDRSQVRHRNPVHEFDEIPDVPFDGPELPARFSYDGGVERQIAWPVPTIRWWGKIRSMPHCKRWTPGDWEYAFGTALVHAKTVEKGLGFAELRARERLMGTTWDARNAMRIKYVAPSEATRRDGGGEKPAASNVIQFDPAAMYGTGA